jgi:uncharacterized protein (DUF362 family)
MAKVVLTKSKTQNYTETDIIDTVERAFDKLDFDFSKEIKKIVIKPNLCYYWNYSTGETTDPRVVSSVIDYIRRKLGTDADISVAEADASAMKTKFAFTVLEYDKLCQTKKVKLINLSEGKIRDVPVKVGEKDLSLPINEILLNADLIINIPKLKTHNFVGATCSLKNVFGAISKPRKYGYHKMINHVIVGANKIVKSHIIIVDGLIAKGSFPKKLGVILAGDDALATDFTAARIMGFNPKRIAHLNLAEKERIGQTRNIKLIEDVKLSEVKTEFPGFNHMMHNFSWNLQLKLLRGYVTVVGDVLPPFVEK